MSSLKPSKGFSFENAEGGEKRLMRRALEGLSVENGEIVIDEQINPETGKPHVLLLKQECDILHGRQSTEP